MEIDFKAGPSERCVNCPGDELTDAQEKLYCPGAVEIDEIARTLGIVAMCGKKTDKALEGSPTSAQNLFPELHGRNR